MIGVNSCQKGSVFVFVSSHNQQNEQEEQRGEYLGHDWVPYADRNPLQSGPESGKLALDQELYHDTLSEAAQSPCERGPG